MTTNSNCDMVLRIDGMISWMLWVIALPTAILMRRSGTAGRWSMGIGLAAWVLLGAAFMGLLELAVVMWLLGGARSGPLSSGFFLIVGLLGALEGIEILCRKYPEDGIVSTAPGEPRMWLWDWLPENLSSRELIMRVGEPLIQLVAGWIAASVDPLLGAYLVVAAIANGILGNILFLREKMEIQQLLDARMVGKSRIGSCGGSADREVPSAGEVRMAFEQPEESPAREGIPDCYRSLPAEVRGLLDWEAIESMYESSADGRVPVNCDRCQAHFRVPRAKLGRRARCPRCNAVFLLCSNAGPKGENDDVTSTRNPGVVRPARFKEAS